MPLILFILFITLLPSCSHQNPWEHSMHQKMQIYGPLAQKKLKPLYDQEHLIYPGKKLALLVFKKGRLLQLWASDDEKWHYIKSYPVLAASGHLGPKLRAGDLQVPEGIYKINDFNPNSQFTLSLQLNYPNDFDKEQASLDGRTNLGENIFIHGKNASIGCIAIGDEPIEELFVLTRLVGKENVDVIISPDDFEDNRLMVTNQSPRWTEVLYQKIKLALQPFHNKSTA
jgi:murein L,D-transpeptidase YafK